MTAFDYTTLLIIGISVVISIMRGAVKEVLAVVGWVLAFYVARTYANQLIPLLPDDIPTEPLKILAAMIILILAVLLLTSLVTIALSGLIRKTELKLVESWVGGVFRIRERGVDCMCAGIPGRIHQLTQRSALD